MSIDITPFTNLIMREEVFLTLIGILTFVLIINQLSNIRIIINSLMKGVQSLFVDFSKNILIKNTKDNTYKIDDFSNKKNNKLMFSLIALQLFIVLTANIVYDHNKYSEDCQKVGYDYYVAGNCVNLIDIK